VGCRIVEDLVVARVAPPWRRVAAAGGRRLGADYGAGDVEGSGFPLDPYFLASWTTSTVTPV
jgi:hypothetical protein